jgi:hypothetical protein
MGGIKRTFIEVHLTNVRRGSGAAGSQMCVAQIRITFFFKPFYAYFVFYLK